MKNLVIIIFIFFCLAWAINPNAIPENTWVLIDSISYDFPQDYTGSFRHRGWCTFTWDPDSQRALFYEGYGGSHEQTTSIYANTLYSFDPVTETIKLIKVSTYWEQISHNQFVPGSGPEMPHPRHTYGGFIYVPKYHRLYMGFGACSGSNNCENTYMWYYTPATDTWTKCPIEMEENGRYDFNFIHFPRSDTIWIVVKNIGTWTKLRAFDMATETWSDLLDYGIPQFAGSWDADEDTLRREALVSTNGDPVRFYIFEPTDHSFTELDNVPSALSGNHAIVYIPKHDLYFIHDRGNGTDWTFNPANRTWQQVQTTDSPADRIDRYIVYDPLNDLIIIDNNPFHAIRFVPGTTSVETGKRKGIEAGLNVSLRLGVYNLRGRLIRELTADSESLRTGLTWNTSGLPAGIYFLKAMGSKRYIRSILIMK